MRHTTILFIAVAILQVYSAPQLISYKEGKLGVNFGGYHAGVGIGGLLGNGQAGGLFAEAGTPHGQSAKAGLGGAVNEHGHSTGGLYAGATAGGNVKASAGLAGGVDSEKSAGTGYASAQAGNHYASSGLGGDASDAGASGFTFSGTKSFGVSKGVVKHTDVAIQPEESIEVKPIHKKVHSEFKFEDENEVNPVPLENEANAQVDLTTNAQPVQEVHAEQPVIYKQKEIIRTHVKPHRHHYHKTAKIHGYIGATGSAVPPPPPQPAPVFYKPIQPVIEKRVDIEAEGAFGAGASAEADVHGGGSKQVAYTKQVSFQRNPTFFADIFNIPISTLKAVGSFLGNTAGSTNISVQKSVHTESESSPKHAAASSEAHVSVQTSPASSFIDDILAIPINTLGAVNKFLENNVPARKRVEYTAEGPEPVRLGPHARRRANKRVVIIQENNDRIAATPSLD